MIAPLTEHTMAGIQPTATLLEEDVDENGDLLPPRLDTININLLGCIYTVKLGIYYLKQNPNGGSIVMTASASSTYQSLLLPNLNFPRLFSITRYYPLLHDINIPSDNLNPNRPSYHHIHRLPT